MQKVINGNDTIWMNPNGTIVVKDTQSEWCTHVRNNITIIQSLMLSDMGKFNNLIIEDDKQSKGKSTMKYITREVKSELTPNEDIMKYLSDLSQFGPIEPQLITAVELVHQTFKCDLKTAKEHVYHFIGQVSMFDNTVEFLCEGIGCTHFWSNSPFYAMYFDDNCSLHEIL